MNLRNRAEDRALIRKCLAGSETAWSEFYARFIGLIRTVVRKYGTLSPEDVEDVEQMAFLSLTTALERYDHHQSLPKFVALVTQRVLVDEIRRRTATKRTLEEDRMECPNNPEQNAEPPESNCEPQDLLMEKAQQVNTLRSALAKLDTKCRQLIKLRYLRELSFKEIAAELESNENTVTVGTRRCLDRLRAKFRTVDQ
ncbi:RNA polymerase sigma factor [Thermodesulfobacteriota bacterium]